MQERVSQAQTMAGEMQGDMDKKIEAVLKPWQVKRLREIDLQWRGPLALTNTALADQVGLAPEQRAKLTEAATALHDADNKARQDAMQQLMGNFAAQRAQAQASGAPMPRFTPPTPEQMQALATKVQDAHEKALKDANAKATAVLTPPQAQAWRALQGKPFRFPTNDY